MADGKQEPTQTEYRFAGNSSGLHTTIPIRIRRIEFRTGTWTPVRVVASIGDSEDDSLPTFSFDLTYRQALESDIIERRS